jgi:hypothetical protein
LLVVSVVLCAREALKQKPRFSDPFSVQFALH